MKYKVVVYNMDDPDVKITVADAYDKKDAQRIMKLLRNPKTWNIERRPGLDTFDRVAMTFVMK